MAKVSSRKLPSELEELSETPVAGRRGRWHQMRQEGHPGTRVGHSDATLTATEAAGVSKGSFLSITGDWMGRCKTT